MKSNITSTKCIETARYSNEAYFVGEYFLYFREIKLFCSLSLSLSFKHNVQGIYYLS